MKKRIRVLLNLGNILLISTVFLLISRFESVLPGFSAKSPYLSLGFLIVVAYLGGSVARHFRLPSLTGNLLAGFVFGPPLLGFISSADIKSLELINSLALSFIAISAGGELRLASLKKNLKPILGITVFHTLFICAGMFAVFRIAFMLNPVPALDKAGASSAFCLLLAVIALANSPASTIAVINEAKARGDFTDTVISVTMLKDTIVLILFSVALAAVGGMFSGSSFSLGVLAGSLGHVAMSGAAGIVYGFFMILFFKFIAREISIFIVIVSFIASQFANFIGLEHMFMCLVAGFTVQNLSKQGNVMIEAIENSHLPIYVVFFSIAGAGMNFSYMKIYASLVLIFVVTRAVLLQLSTFLGARVSGTLPSIRRHAWTGFVANAGLALSMLIVVQCTFPEWGEIFKAVVISAIAVNQIIGPVLFSLGLSRSGDAR